MGEARRTCYSTSTAVAATFERPGGPSRELKLWGEKCGDRSVVALPGGQGCSLYRGRGLEARCVVQTAWRGGGIGADKDCEGVERRVGTLQGSWQSSRADVSTGASGLTPHLIELLELQPGVVSVGL